MSRTIVPTDGFDVTLAYRCAVLSAMAYCTPNERIDHYLTRLKIPLGMTQGVHYISQDNAQAYMLFVGDAAFLVIRGTQVTSGWSWSDVLDNIRMKKVITTTGCHVHAGYLSYLNDLAPEVNRQLRMKQPKKLVITGHSLGGAVATIAHLRWNSICYTFGAPRSGDKDFAKDVSPNLYRVVHADDIAPKYPTPLLTGYRHAGEYWHVSRSGKLVHKFWNYWDQMLVPFTRWGVTQGVLDHRIEEYASKLQGPQL